MPPRGGTPWASSRGTLLSDRIRPSGLSQAAKSEKGQGKVKGKGRANVATPEPPRSAAVRKLDELIEGLLSSESTPSASRPQPRTQNKSVAEDREACFCQGKRSFLSSCLETHHLSSSPLIVYFSYHLYSTPPTPRLTHRQPACTHYPNTPPFAPTAASSSACTITRTAPARTAPRPSSLPPRVAHSSHSSTNCARRR
jgi:hypothetical protein